MLVTEAVGKPEVAVVSRVVSSAQRLRACEMWEYILCHIYVTKCASFL
jgi:hypothetical protein